MKPYAYPFIVIVAGAMAFIHPASAANLREVHVLSGNATNYANQGGSGSGLAVSFKVNDAGLDHVCQLTWSTDGWRTQHTANATYSYTSGVTEFWNASASAPGSTGATFVYSVACTDYGQTQTVYAQTGALTSYGVTVRDQVNVAVAHW
jgi:hypothetical protein